MAKGIIVKILGDQGPFSNIGQSIGYLLTVGGSSYLLDIGSPIFHQLSWDDLKNIKGVMLTHCHDDHKRWFTDYALFCKYVLNAEKKAFITTEDIYEEAIRSSSAALDRSLSSDSKRIIDIGNDEYFTFNMLGPKARYRITSIDGGNGRRDFRVVDSEGGFVPPDLAKIVINTPTKRPRLLFRDPQYREWIEPESFYPFTSRVFYEEDKNIFHDAEGFSIEAVKSPVWHGITSTGMKIKTGSETLIFSADTINNKHLWQKLCAEKREQTLHMSVKEFESASVIYGDINDYIERVWSEERYNDALTAFNDAVVMHDITIGNNPVHTSYEALDDTGLKKEISLLTHCPDRITSEWILTHSGKEFKIEGKEIVEIAGEEKYPMNADIYHKEARKYWVGYRNENGKYAVYKKDGLLSLSKDADEESGGPLFRVDLYEDINGSYFPKLEDDSSVYLRRHDGKVELVKYNEEGSSGKVIKDCRGDLSGFGTGKRDSKA
jgi:ribonuclease BN (tRNA processing enzyme)